MTALAFGAAAFCATMLGGAVALRLRDRLHLILGFSAGAVVAVAFFDLLPEAFDHAVGHHDSSTVAAFVALGFLVYLLLDRLLLLGHDHATPAEQAVMWAAQAAILRQIGAAITAPGPLD